MQPFCPCSRALNWTGKGLRSDTYLKLLPLFGIRKFCPNLACLIIVPVWPCLCIVKMSWPVELLQIILRLKWVDVDDPHTMTHWSFVHPHQWFSCVARKRKKFHPEGVKRQNINVSSVVFHCAVWGVFWNTMSSEMWRCKISWVGYYYMHTFITNKLKKESSFCLF